LRWRLRLRILSVTHRKQSAGVAIPLFVLTIIRGQKNEL